MITAATNQPTLIVIGGPTAVGKTRYAIEIAQKFHTSIISADSRQFYKEMRIGTAFPSEEELAAVKHYFVGHLSIGQYYSTNPRPSAWKANALSTELFPQLCLSRSVPPDLPYNIIRWFQGSTAGTGFPASPCPALWVKMDSNHRSRETADLQSAPFGHSGIHPLRAASRNRTNNLRITSALLYH